MAGLNPKKIDGLKEPVVRDYMAIERTVMANERTFLSYIRSALGLFIGGASFVEFFESQWIVTVGWIFLPLGVLAFLLGLRKYKRINDLIRGAEEVCHLEPAAEPARPEAVATAPVKVESSLDG
jgi:putative membrane protein